MVMNVSEAVDVPVLPLLVALLVLSMYKVVWESEGSGRQSHESSESGLNHSLLHRPTTPRQMANIWTRSTSYSASYLSLSAPTAVDLTVCCLAKKYF